jgi:26S proteasome regulatory subunit N7
VRDLKRAAELFLDAVSTFTSYELMEYEQLVVYTVVAAMFSLERTELEEKVVRGAEIQEQLHGAPWARSFVESLYRCEYGEFFRALAEVERRLKFDRLLGPHYGFYVRAMRVKAYGQMLKSYRSLTLDYMASAFGVSVEFVDKELHQLIATGALHCKIDKVKRVVETGQLDTKNHQYQALIKQGDVLLNRVQKLGRVINA